MTRREFSEFRRSARSVISRSTLARLRSQPRPSHQDCPSPQRKGRTKIYTKINENLQYCGIVKVNNNVIQSGFPRHAERESNERLQKDATQ